MDSGSAHLMTILALADMLCYLGENIFMSSNLEIYRKFAGCVCSLAAGPSNDLKKFELLY